MVESHDELTDQAEHSRPDNQEKRGTTRREFARTLAAIATTPFLFSGLAGARTRELAAADPPDLLALIPAQPQAQPPEKPLPEAEALAELARIQYGKNLSDDQMAEVKRSLSSRFRASEAMKKIKLANGDEPAFIFSANTQ
jgi:hypothetical protein